MSAVVINGGLVHYEAFGKGNPILFLHGWLGSWRYWYQTMTSLAVDHRVYALDLWGFGDSAKSDSKYKVNHYVALVESFIADLGLDEPVLVGHSLGASIAIEYAFKDISPINKVMAVSIPLAEDAVHSRIENYANASMVSRLIRGRLTLPKEVEEEAERADPQVIPLSLKSFKEHCSLNKLTKTNSDILIVFGEKDDLINSDLTSQLAGYNHIRSISLADSHHFPMIDEGNKFNRLLKEFADPEATLESLSLKEEWRRRIR
ncbi:MAG: alpha/beta hydrolase [Chloroflexota bacterium]